MKKELVIKRCSKCQSLVEVIKDCTSDNCSIKCCGEEMIELEIGRASCRERV